MEHNIDDTWSKLSPEEKKRHLYEKKKHTHDLFLQRNAITKAQYDKSLSDLAEKMGYGKGEKQ